MEFCGRASQALDANDKATATEKMELKITYLNMVSYGENTRKATLQELADGLFADKEVEYVKLKNQEVATLQPIDVTGESSFFVKLKEYSYEFEIDENLQLASVDGVKMDSSYDELKITIDDLKTTIENLKKSDNEKEQIITEMKEDIEELKGSKMSNQKVSLLKNAPVTVNTPLSEWNECSIDIELSESFKNYKYLEIQFDCLGDFGSALQSANYYSTEQLQIYDVNNYSVQKDNTFFITLNSSGNSYGGLFAWFKSEKILHIGATSTNRADWKSIRIKNIYGIK